MPMSPARDEYIIAGDLTFHCLQWGESGTPIICVHGLTANAFCFQALADELAPDHRVIAYDLRGRGDSDKPESGYSIPIHAADLVELIDVLELDRPVVGAILKLDLLEQGRRAVSLDMAGDPPWLADDLPVPRRAADREHLAGAVARGGEVEVALARRRHCVDRARADRLGARQLVAGGQALAAAVRLRVGERGRGE